MYLLDTDTIIYSLKGNKAVKNELQKHLHDPLKLSVITLMELYYGAYKSQKMESNIAKIKTIETSLDILPINQELVEVFGMLKSKLEKAGKGLDDFDLIIASTALTHNLVLVTNNEKHFQRITGLEIENWSKP
ncbi:MAG: type II toxin-antitoxin system VapC family toxin [Candidatus Marinimicrobia bacterium]|nr:type II toxin-antitoxin system VapC family toxin [Candidatus Neomarinimicrobiota bacterium]MCH8069105.1 type II toxin-antitoxin system VapC family toxin [Candidatus Neomarinimicrobiota bacterium]